MRGSTANLYCTSDRNVPTWSVKSFIDPSDDDDKELTDKSCKTTVEFVGANRSSVDSCDLSVLHTVNKETSKYTCMDGYDSASGILIILGKTRIQNFHLRS